MASPRFAQRGHKIARHQRPSLRRVVFFGRGHWAFPHQLEVWGSAVYKLPQWLGLAKTAFFFTIFGLQITIVPKYTESIGSLFYKCFRFIWRRHVPQLPIAGDATAIKEVQFYNGRNKQLRPPEVFLSRRWRILFHHLSVQLHVIRMWNDAKLLDDRNFHDWHRKNKLQIHHNSVSADW